MNLIPAKTKAPISKTIELKTILSKNNLMNFSVR